MRHKINRRTFVGASAASAFAFTYLPRRVWGANERLNVAGIGVGGKGRGDVKDIADEDCNIVALCDVDDARAAESYARFPGARHYRDFRVMLEKQKDIDAVMVSTPDHTHAPASIMAMKMGKHVYCQKPLTHSIHEARLMAQTAAEMKVATQMGNQAHAGEPIRRGVELIRAGIIGPVHEVHTWTNRPIWPQGVHRPTDQPAVPATLDWDLWLGPAPYRPYHPEYVPFNWRGRWDFGTGALGDMGCHIMDMPYWALELAYPTAVEAVSEGMTDDSPPRWSIVTYEFPARGSRPPVKFVWYDGGKLPSADVMEGHDAKRFGSVLIGEKGKMFFNRGSTEPVVLPQKILEDFGPIERTLPRTKNEDFEWMTACKGGPPALSSFSYSGPFTEVVLLGNLAIRAGKRLEWDGPAMKATNAPEADQWIRREYRTGW